MTEPEADQPLDVAIVGAGFAGMYMLYRCRQRGWSARVFEAGSDVGGTWYWNRYPGARCDVESLEYSYSFDPELQQEWTWTERYASQPEILSYARHVADRHDLRDHITFDTRVAAAAWDDDTSTWAITVEPTGDTASSEHPESKHPESKHPKSERPQEIRARYLVMATGCLSAANRPEFPGMGDFGGDIHHTGHWPHEGVNFTGKRVGVIGTGSSGIQAIPVIAKQCAELTVFQRTPNYSLPAHNGPMDPEWEAWVKANYEEFRAANRQQQGAFGSHVPRSEVSALDVEAGDRDAAYEANWQRGGFAMTRSFNDLGINAEANDTAREFVATKIAATVENPETAELLTPEYYFACKRMCVDTGYFETYNLPHVDLVDVNNHPIETFTPTGVRAGGVDHAFDIIVLATGFDAMTGALLRIDITGRDGLALADAWSEGPKTYLGLMVPGFPNLFTVTGPGSPSVLTNMIMAIEHHVEYIDRTIAHLDETGVATIEATPDAALDWVAHVNAVAASTLFTTCNSWYLGVNIPGKPRVYMPLMGFPDYVKRCDEVAADGYPGFVLA